MSAAEKTDGSFYWNEFLGRSDNIDGEIAVDELLSEIEEELGRARAKFPGDNVTFAALIEEVGELAKATFEEPRENVRKEAVQVAVMAIRMVLDGDHTFNAWRHAHGLDDLVAGVDEEEAFRAIPGYLGEDGPELSVASGLDLLIEDEVKKTAPSIDEMLRGEIQHEGCDYTLSEGAAKYSITLKCGYVVTGVCVCPKSYVLPPPGAMALACEDAYAKAGELMLFRQKSDEYREGLQKEAARKLIKASNEGITDELIKAAMKEGWG